MHLNRTIETDKFNLIDYAGNAYYINFNITEQLKEEEKFKNNAFVKTGRLIPTGFTKCWSVVVRNTKPTLIKIKELIYSDINKYVSDRILKGFIWNGYNVWLSSENQKNYADWYLLANNEDKFDSVTAKFNKNGKTVYYEFSTKEEIKSLYCGMVKHINDTINFGRRLKDNLNLSDYKKCLDKL